jgi:hypothetical protein
MRFGVIIMCHGLEHVRDPEAFLMYFRRFLIPSGCVHVAARNVVGWEPDFPGWTSCESHHFMGSNDQTLQVEISGAEIEPVWVVTHRFFSGWVLSVFRTRLRSIRAEGVALRWMTAVGGKREECRPGVIEHTYRAVLIIAGAGLRSFRRLESALGRCDDLKCLLRMSPLGVG